MPCKDSFSETLTIAEYVASSKSTSIFANEIFLIFSGKLSSMIFDLISSYLSNSFKVSLIKS